ncbi:MAG: permease [Deltaproteobacteria bacterium]|nr:permease [Deltaproteobacteria bacterium]
MTFLYEFIKETIFFFNEVSIYLLLGFFLAGILHILFPESIIRRHLGMDTFGSVIKATLFGIPIPICSCGVVPVATSLRNSGASKGATISFLISTPQVGADSFLITYSLLGWVFGIFRIAAALITSIAAGIMVNILAGRDGNKADTPLPMSQPEPILRQRLKSILKYIEYELMGSIANSLIIGIIAAGLISVLIPDGFLEMQLGSSFLSMVLMLAIGIPMYVCASASTPIAASLIMKGISPGAALVFLLAGPATNAVTISTVFKILGKGSAIIYISAITLVSLCLGWLLNIITARYGFQNIILLHQHDMLPAWLKTGGSMTLTLMLGYYYFDIKILSRIKRKKNMEDRSMSLAVRGMTCMHCAGNVKKAAESVLGVINVYVDLERNTVTFKTAKEEAVDQVKEAIRQAGYEV